MGKVSIFLKIIQTVKNWHIVFLVYFGIYKKEFFSLYLKNGLKIKLRTKSTDLQAFANVWILKEYNVEGFEINKNDIIIDIGGHIGLFALYASLNCPSVKIISIEPYPQNFSLLVENLKNNKLDKLIIINKAISKSEKIISLFLDSLDDAAHSIYGKGKKSIKIKATTLGQIMKENQIEKCNILKMDCEGAEFEIIESLTNEELSKIDKIYLEYHLEENKNISLDLLKTRLEKINFIVNINPTNNNLGMLYAIKQIGT